MKIPADCILLEGMDVICDESMYNNGNDVHKKISISLEQHTNENPDPFLLSRSLVLSGSGRAVVCAVGKRTRWFNEHPIEDLEDDNEDTPLTKKLKSLADVVKGYAHIAAFLIFATLLLFLTCNIVFSGSADLLSQKTIQKLIRSITTAVAIVIVSVPEGLSLAVSISMAFSISQMKKN